MRLRMASSPSASAQLGKRNAEIGARTFVRILVDNDVNTLPPKLFHQRERFRARAPDALVVDLEMRQLNRHPGFSSDRHRLFYRLESPSSLRRACGWRTRRHTWRQPWRVPRLLSVLE